MLAHRRRLLRVSEVVLICLTGLVGYKSCMLDRAGDPERAMPAIVFTLGLAVALIGCIVIDLLSASPTPEAGPAGMASSQMDFGEASSVVSGIAGLLAWFPVIPMTGPIVYASVALVAGLLAIRHLKGRDQRRRERAVAVVGAVAGAASLLLRFVFASAP